MTDHQREKFEAAVVQRLKESGFLEIEIRTEVLVRCDDGYQDEVINAGWHYWNAALVADGKAAAAPPPPSSHVTLADRLEAEVKRLDDTPPSIQTQANIRLINAVHEAVAILRGATPPQPNVALLVESGQAFANQVRAVTHKLHGQAYSSTVSALNQFDADLRRARAALATTEGSL